MQASCIALDYNSPEALRGVCLEVKMKLLVKMMLVLALSPAPAIAQLEEPAPLTVEDVRCRGNSLTDCRLILRHVYLTRGSNLDERELENARLRLSALSSFEKVDILLEKGVRRGTVIVVVEVTEASPFAAETVASAGYIRRAYTVDLGHRWSHQNLFGAGKILDFSLRGTLPIDGPRQEGFGAQLQYIDPHLFDSERYYLFGGINFTDERFEFRDDAFNDAGDFSRTDLFGVGVGVGRRLGAFSYVSASLQYRFNADVAFRFSEPDGSIESGRETSTLGWSFNYGWNSEDDPYFPTQGSRFFLSTGRAGSDNDFAIGYRRHWRAASQGSWSFNLGRPTRTDVRPSLEQNLPISFGYARQLHFEPSDARARARWFVELGLVDFRQSDELGLQTEVGIKAGVRILHRSFGIIDLSLLGTSNVGWGGAR
jgi:outer membrane protein assembly factor BamA